MQDSLIPAKFPIPWGNSAGGAYIRSIPVSSQIGIEAGAASLTDGFPPLTQTSVADGGVAPFGQDMNGILKQITLWQQWYQAGGPIGYDGSFAASIGGYPKGAILPSATFLGFWISTVENNLADPNAGGAGWVDLFGTLVGAFRNRAAVAAAAIGPVTPAIFVDGWASAGDTGDAAMYVRGTSGGLAALQSLDGQWWNLAFAGTVNLMNLGAGFSNPAADVAAMTAALALSLSIGGHTYGAAIVIPQGLYDLSLGAFTISKRNTRLLGRGEAGTQIAFNAVSPSNLITFHDGTTFGVGYCEMSNLTIFSTDTAVLKNAVTLKNTTHFKMDRVTLLGMTDVSGSSAGLIYQGRDYMDVSDCTFDADNPAIFQQNPQRASVQNIDADYFSSRRNQFTGRNANSAAVLVTDAVKTSNVYFEDCDFAGVRFGVNNLDTTGTFSSTTWNFVRCRHEQAVGAQPTMFNILRSAGAPLQQLRVEDCVSQAAMFNLTNVWGAKFIQPIASVAGAGLVGQADATVQGLEWDFLICPFGSTIVLTGQTLISGRNPLNSSSSSPLYEEARYANTAARQIQWLTSPSTNGRRAGRWSASFDVPVFTGLNKIPLLPFQILPIVYAIITVSTNGTSGTVEFVAGQASPNGCAIIAARPGLSIDGTSGTLAVFQTTDIDVALINKLPAASPVSIDIFFTV